MNKYEQEINGKLDAQLFNMDEMGGYQVYDANGDVLYSLQRLNARRVNIADQGYFHQLSNDSGEDLGFSDVFFEQRGLQVIVLARALRDGNGHFKGVVCGLIGLIWIITGNNSSRWNSVRKASLP